MSGTVSVRQLRAFASVLIALVALPITSIAVHASAPGAPTGVAGTAVTTSPGQTITVSWTAPTDNGGSTITNYAVIWYPSGTEIVTPNANTSTTIGPPSQPLTNGTSYIFSVTAYNGAWGAWSSWSAPVHPYTGPGTPSNVTAVPGNGSATVSWTPPTSNGGDPVTKYLVYVYPGGTQVATASGTPAPTSLLVSGLTGTPQFAVASYNNAGYSGWSSYSAAVTLATTPTTPTMPTVTAGPSSAFLKWTQPAGGLPVDHYTITPYLGGVAQPTVTVPGAQVSATVPTLSSHLSYTFTVTANPSSSSGGSASSPSPTSTPATPTSTASATVFDKYAYVSGGPFPGYAGSEYNWVRSSASLPAMSSWTIEWSMWNYTLGNASVGCSWFIGVATSTGVEVAGLQFQDQTWAHPGYNWVYPGSGLLAFQETSTIAGASPTHLALSYDASSSTLRMYVNGIQESGSPVTVSSGGISSGGMFEIYANSSVGSEALRDVRVSSAALYTTTQFSPPNGKLPILGSTQLLWHLDDYSVGMFPTVQISYDAGGSPPVFTAPYVWADVSGFGLNGQVQWQGGCGWHCGLYGPVTVQWYELGPGLTLGDLLGGGLPWICPCEFQGPDLIDPIDRASGDFHETFDPLSIPGYGVPLDFGLTYSSRNAYSGQKSALGWGWSYAYGSNVSAQQAGSSACGGSGSPACAVVTAGNGASAIFSLVSGSYDTPTGVLATLAKNPSSGQYTLTDESKDVTTFDTDANGGRLLSQVDPSGKGVTVTYPQTTRTVVTDAAGRTFTLNYNGSGQLTTVQDQGSNSPSTPQRTVTFSYDASGNLSQFVVSDNGSPAYSETTAFTSYDSNHGLQTIKDPNCVQQSCPGVRNVYDSSGRLSSQTSATGHTVITITYWASGPESITTVQTADQTVTPTVSQYTCDHYLSNVLTFSAQLTSAPTAGTCSLPQGSSAGSSLGTVYTSDTATLATTGIAHELASPSGNLNQDLPPPLADAALAVRDMNNADATARANVLSAFDDLGRKSVATYNSYNEPSSTIDPANVSTSNIYDWPANLASGMQPAGRLTETCTPLDTLTACALDGQQRLPDCGVNDPVPAHESDVCYYYTDSAHPEEVSKVVDAEGNPWLFSYDPSYGALASTTDPKGNLTTTTYDIDGRLLTHVSPKGSTSCNCTTSYTTSYAYAATSQGNRIQTISAPETATTPTPTYAVTTMLYDADGNLVETCIVRGGGACATPPPNCVSVPSGEVDTCRRYDSDGRLTELDRGDGSWQKTGYDGFGHVVSQTAGSGTTTITSISYGYNLLDQRTSMTAGSDPSRTYTYDAAGRLLTEVDPRGNAPGCSCASQYTITYGYDLEGQLANVAFGDGLTPGVSLGYDALGRRVKMADATGVSSWTYDTGGRLTQFQSGPEAASGGANNYVAYTYDRRGLELTIQYPGTTNKVTTAYDSDGRVSSIQDWSSHTTSWNYEDGTAPTTAGTNPLTYRSQTQVTYPSGFVATTWVDQLSRVVEMKDQKGTQNPLNDFQYGRDATGELTGDGQTYAYDAAGRLCYNNCTVTSGQSTYAYDAADDPTKVTNGSGASTTFGPYASDGELPTYTNSNGTDTISYDSAGDRTGESVGGNSTRSIAYDLANRMATFWQSVGASEASVYDGLGDRILKEVQGSMESWDMATSLPLLLQDGSTSYVYGPGGLPLEQISSGGAVLYYLADQQGSTRDLTDGTGAMEDSYSYDPYGNVSRPFGSDPNPLLYDGQYQDESSLYYLRARYYDPGTAQFLSRDPAVSSTREPYVYAADMPLDRSDPSGLDEVSDGGAGWGDCCMSGPDSGADNGGTPEDVGGPTSGGPDPGKFFSDFWNGCKQKLQQWSGRGSSTEAPVSPFVPGQLYESEMTTSSGEVIRGLGEVKVEGDTLVLSDVAIYADGPDVPNTVSPGELRAWARQIAQQAAATTRYRTLAIRGIRVPTSSSAMPGKAVNITIDLTQLR